MDYLFKARSCLFKSEETEEIVDKQNENHLLHTKETNRNLENNNRKVVSA